MAKKKSSISKHRLLVYQRLGQRLRTAPFLILLVGLFLLGLGWLSNQGILQGGNITLLQSIWAGRALLIAALVACFGLFILTLMIGQYSTVEARRTSLHVQAGLLALNISYRRIRQIRLSTLGDQYSDDQIKGGEWGMVEPLLNVPCTLVDLQSWPWPGEKALHRLWSRFMFGRDSASLMFVVQHAMNLNQQIDTQLSARQGKSRQVKYVDPITRAAQIEKQSRMRR